MYILMMFKALYVDGNTYMGYICSVVEVIP